MKRLIRNDNYALSTSDFPLWSASKDQRLNENRDVQDSIIALLATGGSKDASLSFVLQGQWNGCFFFFPIRFTGSVLSHSHCNSSCIRVLGICTHTLAHHRRGFVCKGPDCSGSSVFLPCLNLDTHLPPFT